MHYLLLFEAIVLYCCLSIIVVRIYDFKFNNNNVFFSLIYVPIICVVPYIKLHTFVLCYHLLSIMNIILIKVCYSQLKITSLIYLYILLLISTAGFTSTLVAVIPQNKILIEIGTYIIMLVGCCVIAYTGIRNKFKSIIRWIPKFVKIIILAILIFMSFIGILIYGIYDRSPNANWVLMMQLFVMLMIVFVCLLLPVVINNSVNNQYLKRLTDNYQKQIEVQANHYTALAKSNWELRRFRHDFKNLWIGLNELIGSGETQEALTMLNKCHGTFVNATDAILKFDTGNGIVDALLSDKQEIAQLQNATIEFSGAVPSKGISPTDLCVLFGNTLDNAIEACEKMPLESKKTISITCKPVGGYLFICISNPVMEDIEIRNNSIPTTKEDKTVHGFGLYSLEKIVKNHDGELTLRCSNKLFEVSIDLCIDL